MDKNITKQERLVTDESNQKVCSNKKIKIENVGQNAHGCEENLNNDNDFVKFSIQNTSGNVLNSLDDLVQKC